jgi:hypothetical protein
MRQNIPEIFTCLSFEMRNYTSVASLERIYLELSTVGQFSLQWLSTSEYVESHHESEVVRNPARDK